MTRPFNVSLRKVGGIRFLKIGRLNVSVSVSRRQPSPDAAARAGRRIPVTHIPVVLAMPDPPRRPLAHYA